MKSSGRGFKLTARSLHQLPHLTPRVSGGSRHGYRHPRGQNSSEVSGLEGGGHVCDLPVPAQVL